MQLESPPDSTPVLAGTLPNPDALATQKSELDGYVRRTVTNGLLVFAALLGALAFAGIKFEAELLAATAFVENALGLAGLALLVFAADSLTTPIPPDLVLMVVAKSSLASDWLWIVPGLGLVSAIAGNLGYFLGLKLRNTRLAQLLFSRFREKNAALLLRYGWLAVALGALTPLPFSITCWAAGMLQMRWAAVAAACCLRVPRFIVYYLMIAHSGRLLELFW